MHRGAAGFRAGVGVSAAAGEKRERRGKQRDECDDGLGAAHPRQVNTSCGALERPGYGAKDMLRAERRPG